MRTETRERAKERERRVSGPGERIYLIGHTKTERSTAFLPSCHGQHDDSPKHGMQSRMRWAGTTIKSSIHPTGYEFVIFPMARKSMSESHGHNTQLTEEGSLHKMPREFTSIAPCRSRNVGDGGDLRLIEGELSRPVALKHSTALTMAEAKRRMA